MLYVNEKVIIVIFCLALALGSGTIYFYYRSNYEVDSKKAFKRAIKYADSDLASKEAGYELQTVRKKMEDHLAKYYEDEAVLGGLNRDR